jgi:hypothetical protein
LRPRQASAMCYHYFHRRASHERYASANMRRRRVCSIRARDPAQPLSLEKIRSPMRRTVPPFTWRMPGRRGPPAGRTMGGIGPDIRQALPSLKVGGRHERAPEVLKHTHSRLVIALASSGQNKPPFCSRAEFGLIPQRPTTTARSGAVAERWRPRRFFDKGRAGRGGPDEPIYPLGLALQIEGWRPWEWRPTFIIGGAFGACEPGYYGSRESGSGEIGTQCFECRGSDRHPPYCRASSSAAWPTPHALHRRASA